MVLHGELGAHDRGEVLRMAQSVSIAAHGVTATVDEGLRSQNLAGGAVVESMCRVVVTSG